MTFLTRIRQPLKSTFGQAWVHNNWLFISKWIHVMRGTHLLYAQDVHGSHNFLRSLDINMCSYSMYLLTFVIFY